MRFLCAFLLFLAFASVSSHPFDSHSQSHSKDGCTASYGQIEGPYWADGQPIRSDVREGQPGVPLYLNIVLLNQSNTKVCQPLVGAAVDIWHTNSSGYYAHFTGYSPDKPAPGIGPAVPTDNLTFMRGVQISDQNGQANFTTIYPGWYYGRCIHIHVEVHLQGTVVGGNFVSGGSDAYIGQLFFDDAWTAKIAKLAPYSSHTTLTYTPNSKDQIYLSENGSANLLNLVPINAADLTKGFSTTFVLNVDTSSQQQKISILNRQNPLFRSYSHLY